MDWKGQRQSDNVRDVRGTGGGGGGGGMRIGGRGVGIGTIIIALAASFFFGINPLSVIGMLGGGGGEVVQSAPAPQRAPGPQPPSEDPEVAFIRTVLADTEDVWARIYPGKGGYRPARLTIYSGNLRTGCGVGSSAMGPFYCPADGTVYLDPRFFKTLSQRMGAPGEFAQAYVIAHEVAHHVQNQLGITDRVDSMRGRLSEVQMNNLSVRVELQADCMAGAWAHHSQKGKGWLDRSDIEAAMNAAAQIGDDNLQAKSQGVVVPESFTHGTSRQRVDWFTRGLQTGNLGACDPFDPKVRL